MAITVIDKIKINDYMRKTAASDIYYKPMRVAICKKGNIKDIEFLEYFVEYTVEMLSKDEKVSFKNLLKYVFVIGNFLVIANDENQEVSDDILNKIRSLDDFYNDYLKRMEIEPDLEFENVMKSVLDTVNELYPSENKKEIIIEYINKISELEKNIKEFERKQIEVSNLCKSLQESCKEKNIRLDEFNKEVMALQSSIKHKESEIIELNSKIVELEKIINELENKITFLENDNDELNLVKERYLLLTNEVEKLKEFIKNFEDEKSKNYNLEIREKKLESLIYKKLLLGELTISEIINSLKKEGFICSLDEVNNILKKIRTRINIVNGSFSTSKTYKVASPNIIENDNLSINLNSDSSYYDIMLVSDFHISEFNTRTLNGLDKLYDYCVSNNIKLILNLGDFFHGLGGKPCNYYDALKNYSILEDTVLKMPKIDGVYHAILGGNHDKKLTAYGFNPLNFLASEREDFIDLGYTHSTISLNLPNQKLGEFDLHHPDTFDFPIDFTDDGISSLELISYLDNVYKKQGRKRKDSYIDILGHTHKSQFNSLDSYVYVPAFFEKETKRGACHLRIYYDTKGIKYMIFMPLSFINQLVKTNEIVYEKVLSNKKNNTIRKK